MKASELKKLSVLFLLLGAAGAALYRVIYTTAVDDRALIVRGTAPELCLWVLTALVLILAVIPARRIRFAANGNPPAVGSLALAAGTYTLSLIDPVGPAALQLVYSVMIWVSVASLVLAAVLRLAKRNHPFILNLAPCILCILHLVECYQLWSELPLVLDYFFCLGAVLCSSVFFYEKTAIRSALPMKGAYVFCALSGIYFCVAAVAGRFFPFYFLGMAVYIIFMLFVPMEQAPEETDAAA